MTEEKNRRKIQRKCFALLITLNHLLNVCLLTYMHISHINLNLLLTNNARMGTQAVLINIKKYEIFVL